MFSPGTTRATGVPSLPRECEIFTMPAEMNVNVRNQAVYHPQTMSPPRVVTSPNNINNRMAGHCNGHSADGHLMDRSKLLLLAEHSNAKKSPSSSSPTHHLLSFRNSMSPKKSSVSGGTSFMRRNSSATAPPDGTPNLRSMQQTPRQNPKLYTSFSSKSTSKLTKAFIRTDPAKTNIEHLVSHKKTSPTSEDVIKPKIEQCENGRGLSNFITPLKALHASFHDKTKLANAFAPRSRLFSQREKSGSHTKSISSPIIPRPENIVDILAGKCESPQQNPVLSNSSEHESRKDSPDFLEYYGTDEREHPNVLRYVPGSDAIRKSATPDILEDCVEFDQESGYIILERGRRAAEIKNRQEVPSDKHSPSNSKNEDSTSCASNKTAKAEGVANENYSSKMMSTATPMKISSSSACRAQIITLMARNNSSNNISVDNGTTINSIKPQNGTCDANIEVTAGVDLKGVSSGNRIQVEKTAQQKNKLLRQNQPQNEKRHPDFAGSSTWINSKPSSSRDKCEKDITPLISKVSNNTRLMHKLPSSSSGVYIMNDQNEMDSGVDYKTAVETKQQVRNETPVALETSLSANMITDLHLHDDYGNNRHEMSPGTTGRSRQSYYHPNDHTDSTNAFGLICKNDSSSREFLIEENHINIENSHHKPIINGGGASRPSVRKLSSRSARLKSKCRPQKGIMHSLSFRSDEKSTTTGCGYSNMNSIEDKFNRNRSRSLPKSFMSVKNGLRSVLPSSWTRDELLFQRLEEQERKSSCPESPSNLPLETAKMRWQKSATSSSSSSISGAASAADGRPKSFDYSQRKAWMKYYRDMEVSSATKKSSTLGKGSKAISKDSISHLHLLESREDVNGYGIGENGAYSVHGNPNTEMSIASRNSTDALGLTPSLFQRFSKTFSMRFGSNSNVNKVSNHGKKIKGPVGSSPDLANRTDDGNSGKMRKGKSKSVRGEKCQSGDSGIGMDDPHPPITNRLRRIRSEFLETSSEEPNTSRMGSSGSSSTLTKMSLVEIPNHVWEEARRVNEDFSNLNIVSANTTSYEDILEAKLDGEDDDGFSSGDDSNSNDTARAANPAYYHSLPLKNSRKNNSSQNNHNSQPGDGSPSSSGRSKSLEESQLPIEDNSTRGKVIKEIIMTEQNYVKTLNDIVQGFLNPCRARQDLFSGGTVRNIFSNIEDILRLHARFLEAFKKQLDPSSLSASNVGQIFTDWADHFDLYSEYCCNNPISMATVRSLIQSQEYAEFFEACRRLQLMDKLPLHGFLLRPIQRICQYHLQLNELLKQTEATHSDYPFVVEAVETMKSVAMKINDTQRQFDSLQEIVRLQHSIEGWEGMDLINRNSVILVKGELVKAAMGKRHKDAFCFLLNKDLVYCKKDFIRKGGFVYDGRIDLEVGVWLNIDSNEEDEFFGMVHNSWRIYSPELKTWILFTASSPTEKRKWITALERTAETFPVDPKMANQAKLITALTSHSTSSHHYSSNSNTLPKSSKKSKGKHSSSTSNKIDADAMLIEVSKLKRPTYSSQQHHPTHKERTSRFYV